MSKQKPYKKHEHQSIEVGRTDKHVIMKFDFPLDCIVMAPNQALQVAQALIDWAKELQS